MTDEELDRLCDVFCDVMVRYVAKELRPIRERLAIQEDTISKEAAAAFAKALRGER